MWQPGIEFKSLCLRTNYLLTDLTPGSLILEKSFNETLKSNVLWENVLRIV